MKTKYTCIGTGLVGLDMLMRGYNDRTISCRVGGTCGNVMMILSHMGWKSYPIVRLDNSDYSRIMRDDMVRHNVSQDYIYVDDKAKTPVIIQHNIIDRYGNPTHRFTFKNDKGQMFLAYSPVKVSQAKDLINKINIIPDVFFFDRVESYCTILAAFFKSKGSLVYFEPSSIKSKHIFDRSIELSDIVKFSEQRLKDILFVEKYSDKLFIQTLGANGLRFNCCGRGWKTVDPIKNDNIVDTSGAGDWTTSAFLDELAKAGIHRVSDASNLQIADFLAKAQVIGSRSCSFEGARGMMD